MNEYPGVRQGPFADHPLAHYIRDDLPKIFGSLFPDQPDLIWTASPGQGGWADAPWIAFFNPLVTESPQKGYFPVYLFTRSLDAVYLSMNQGMTELREEFGGSQAKDILSSRAAIIRRRLRSGYQGRFNHTPIDLQPGGQHTRLAFYEPGHAFGVRYSRNDMPNDDRLISDLAAMLELYGILFIRGGTKEFDQSLSTAEETQSDLSDISLEERRRVRLHYTVDRNPRLARLAKEIHGYRCQVCGFDYGAVYGKLGRNYIEAHHLTPLSQLPPSQSLRLSPAEDFAVICANCHRMIHRSGSPETFEEFVQLYNRLKVN